MKAGNFNNIPNNIFQEGPHSKLNEEVFFDAVDTALDEEDANDRMDDITKENIPPPKPTSELAKVEPKHKYSKEVFQFVFIGFYVGFPNGAVVFLKKLVFFKKVSLKVFDPLPLFSYLNNL